MNVDKYKELKELKYSRIQIATFFNVTENQIKSFIKKNNLGTVKPVVNNINAFSTYNEHSSYWGGFIGADGCVTAGTLKICLGYDDLSHLEKFKDFMQNTHKITVNTDTYYRCEMSFKQEQVISDLDKNFNIVPNKSLIYKFPTEIPENMFRHYLRGLFDGDGCICESFSNKNSITATLYTTITGSEFLIENLYIKINNILGINGTVQSKPGCKVIKYCTKSSFILLNYMYENSTIYLDRKFNMYKNVLNQRKTR
jgi:intein/homing endonuclease